MKLIALVLLAVLTVMTSSTPSYEVGAIVENFTLTDAISGKKVSLNDYAKSKAVVVIFTSNYCPYTKLYDARLVSLASEFGSQGVNFILINPVLDQSGEDESVSMMAKRAKEASFSFPYLKDADQAVAKKFSAKKTPEVFLLQNTAKGFMVKYRGAIDDNPQVEEDVKASYLKSALTAVLNNGTVVEKNTRPTGCIIKLN